MNTLGFAASLRTTISAVSDLGSYLEKVCSITGVRFRYRALWHLGTEVNTMTSHLDLLAEVVQGRPNVHPGTIEEAQKAIDDIMYEVGLIESLPSIIKFQDLTYREISDAASKIAANRSAQKWLDLQKTVIILISSWGLNKSGKTSTGTQNAASLVGALENPATSADADQKKSVEVEIEPSSFLDSLLPKERKCFDEIKFFDGENKCVALPLSKNQEAENQQHIIASKQSSTDVTKFASIRLSEGDDKISLGIAPASLDQVHLPQAGPNLRLIILDPRDRYPDQDEISLSQKSFISVVRTLKITNEFTTSIRTGTPFFKEVADRGCPTDTFKYILRTPRARTCSWTVAVSFNPVNGTTSAMIHGIQTGELDGFVTGLDYFKSSEAVHPLLLPTIACGLLAESDAKETRSCTSDLDKIQTAITLIQVDPAKDNARFESKLFGSEHIPSTKTGQVTHQLNRIRSSLAFYEMRTKANMALTSALVDHVQKLEKEIMLSNDQRLLVRGGLQRVGNQIQHRLQNLQIELDALLNEINCCQKIASDQLLIIYNFVTQRDARENLKIALTSQSIATVTREDSFAMRAIAVMTMAFLPGTAISSLFSMSMFSWQPSPGQRVVSRHFWIYWVVIIPLTLFVLILWRIWIKWHRKRQGEPTAPSFADKPGFMTRLSSKLFLPRPLKQEVDVEKIEIENGKVNNSEGQAGTSPSLSFALKFPSP